MRVKQGFVMREVAGVGVVIATGEASKAFHGMIKLNDTGQLIWRGLEEDLICGACIAACPYAQRWRATASRPPQLALHGLQ